MVKPSALFFTHHSDEKIIQQTSIHSQIVATTLSETRFKIVLMYIMLINNLHFPHPNTDSPSLSQYWLR